MGRRGSRTRLRQLTDEEVAKLEQIRGCGNERLNRIRRANVVLTARDGLSSRLVAEFTGYSSRGVEYLVARFNVVGLAVLDVAAGRGRKRSYDEVARGMIVAMAQRTPDRREDGSATWSLSLLVRALRQGGLPQVSATTVRRVLHEAGSSYQRTRTWCPTGTAIRKRKDSAVAVRDPLTEQKRGPSTGPIALVSGRA
jgi:transposase